MKKEQDRKGSEGERIVCRVRRSTLCHHGRPSFPVYDEDEGMSGDRSWDGRSVICEACFTGIGMAAVEPGGDPGTSAGGRGRGGGDR